jgi:hypothetical protein
VSGITEEIISNLLPPGPPPRGGVHPSIRRYTADLPEPYDRALLWIAAVEASLTNWPVPDAVPKSAITSFGFAWQEDNRPGLAATFRWPGWAGPPRQIGEVRVSDSDVTVPVFATGLIRHPQVLPHPPRGLRTCFFRSDGAEEQLFLTAAHVLDCVHPEDELRPGAEVWLKGSATAEKGRLVAVDPHVMDAALVSVLHTNTEESAGLEIAQFVAPGEPVVVAVRGGQVRTRVAHVSGPAKGIVNAHPRVTPKLQSIVFLEDSFHDGDSGALVMSQLRGDGVSMYQGALSEWDPEDRRGYGVLLRQPLIVFDLRTTAEVDVDGRNVTA